VPLGGTPFHQWVFPGGVPWTEFHRTDCGYLLRFPNLADYTVSPDGRDISCHPVPRVSEETTRHLYLNQVLPLALSRLGKLVFHASAVDVGGDGVAFAGESGRGKSTLAASFATDGSPFLTDDGLVIEEREADYWVAPSHPSIRLWDDSQEALVWPETPTAEPVPFTSKIRFLAGEDIAHCDEPRPLRHVYFLGEGGSSRVTIEPMSASEALIELVKHSFLLDIQAHEFITAHFDRLSRLVGRRIYFRLDYPRKFELLPEVRQAILTHCGL
jgi:hypothetical protein